MINSQVAKVIVRHKMSLKLFKDLILQIV